MNARDRGAPGSDRARLAPALTSILVATVLGSGCGADAGPTRRAAELRERFNLEALGPIPYPQDNLPRADRIALGRLLFYDPILGGERDVACGTCHHPDFGFADGRQLGAGVSGVGLGPARTLSQSAISGAPIGPEPRHTPTVMNTAFAHDLNGQSSPLAPLFWDGRALGLEDQALQPLSSRAEMRGDAFPGTEEEASAVAVDSILNRLREVPEYTTLFRTAFPAEAEEVDAGTRANIIDRTTLGRALAAYQRELVTRDAPYDRFVAGDDEALSAVQLDGLELYFSQAKCFLCHDQPSFSSFGFLVTGVPPTGPGKSVLPGDDAGREEHTGERADRYRFRVPSLRNVELTPPYMHSGVFATLDDVVRFYNRGARPRHPQISEDDLEVALRDPLDLTDDEAAALVEFLRSLTDPGRTLDPSLLEVPNVVPSGLAPVFGVRESGR